MALTKVKGSGLATGAATASLVGIDDNATSTAITIDASENVGIGTTNPLSKLTVGGNAITTLKPTLAITDTTAGASLSIRGLSPTIAFDQTGGGAGTILSDNVDILFKNGYLDAYGTETLRIQSGGGISFNGDTAAANALDDYEEGTWTPTAVTGITGLSITKATYTKIGNAVIVRAYMGGVSGQSSNLLQLGGLPFTSVSDGWAVGVMNYGGVNTIYNPQARVRSNANILDFKQGSDDSFVGTSLTGHLIFTVTYEAA